MTAQSGRFLEATHAAEVTDWLHDALESGVHLYTRRGECMRSLAAFWRPLSTPV